MKVWILHPALVFANICFLLAVFCKQNEAIHKQPQNRKNDSSDSTEFAKSSDSKKQTIPPLQTFARM